MFCLSRHDWSMIGHDCVQETQKYVPKYYICNTTHFPHCMLSCDGQCSCCRPLLLTTITRSLHILSLPPEDLDDQDNLLDSSSLPVSDLSLPTTSLAIGASLAISGVLGSEVELPPSAIVLMLLAFQQLMGMLALTGKHKLATSSHGWPLRHRFLFIMDGRFTHPHTTNSHTRNK
jgi:hypothetical protein